MRVNGFMIVRTVGHYLAQNTAIAVCSAPMAPSHAHLFNIVSLLVVE